MSKQSPNDFYSARGAAVLADRIEAYWRKRGFAGVVVMRVPIEGWDGSYGVKSNLIGGLPPKVGR